MSIALIDTLKDAGKPTHLIETADGTRVLLLPYGGRVLGLFSASSDENFYWTNPALDSAETAKAFYASDEWHNSGGDRTWLSPEVDVFLPNYPTLDRYWQPRELDPGSYQIVNEQDSLKLVNRLELKLSRSKCTIGLEIAKQVEPAPNPLRHEKNIDLSGIEYAGYTQRTSLEITSNCPDDIKVGLWDLVQMPHGGDLLIPTHVKAVPKLYFGNIPPDDLLVSDHMVRYKMRQTGEHKCGIRAVATTGRIGYIYKSGDKWALIVRNFLVNPSGDYVDVPWDDPEDLGYSAQACNVNSSLGSFSELEYHIPAIGGTINYCRDAAQVWAFRGSWEAVRAICGTLLCGL